MIITVIAYRENGTDTCRGCVMERWGSDLIITVSQNPDDIVGTVSNLMICNERESGSYTFTFLVDGKPVNLGGEYVNDFSYDPEDDYEIAEVIVQNILNEATSQYVAQLADIKATEAQLAREKANDAERQRKNYDLAELRRLRKLYPEAV